MANHSSPIRIAIAYNLLTMSDGALRMIVLFHYASLGYSAFSLATVFAIYELCGIVVNLVGGALAQRLGALATLRVGLLLQATVLVIMAIPSTLPAVWIIMLLQGCAGIAKDLTKISAKSAITALHNHDSTTLFRAIAWLTGAKNTLKGVGFFIGGVLFVSIGIRGALLGLAIAVIAGALGTIGLHNRTLNAKNRAFQSFFSTHRAVNMLSGARVFLFGARDIWLAVAFPLFLAQAPGWGFWQSGSIMAAYTIGYGMIQAVTPRLLAGRSAPDGRFTALLALIPLIICVITGWYARSMDVAVWVMLMAVSLFSVSFALNSAVHSFLIAAYAQRDAISLNIGAYYSANALGRLCGTLLSGWCYSQWGMSGVLLAAGIAFVPAALLAIPLPARAAYFTANEVHD